MKYSRITEYTYYSLKRVVLLFLGGVFCYYSRLLSSPEKQEKSIRNLGSRRGLSGLSGSSRKVVELPFEDTGKLLGNWQTTITQVAAGSSHSAAKFPIPCGFITISHKRRISKSSSENGIQENQSQLSDSITRSMLLYSLLGTTAGQAVTGQ